MSDKKHTAIDWMYELYLNQGRILQAQFEQAKELEKSQIVEAFDTDLHNENCGCGKCDFCVEFTSEQPINGEQYYSQKYNQ